MLWTIFVILLVLWILGMVTSYTMGGFIHILLIVAIIVVLIRIIQGRRVLQKLNSETTLNIVLNFSKKMFKSVAQNKYATDLNWNINQAESLVHLFIIMNKITLILIIPLISIVLTGFDLIQEIIKTDIWAILIIFMAIASVSAFILKLFMK